MVVTDDDETADRLRLFRSHGMTTLTWDRHRGHASSYDVVLPGFNFRLDELRAAIGIVQLRRLQEVNAARGRVAARYAAALDGTKGMIFPFAQAEADIVSAHHLAVVVLPAGSDRSAVQRALRERAIQTSVHYPPIHSFAAYADGPAQRPLPRTDDLGRRVLTLPLFAHITDGQVEAVVETLTAAVADA